MSASPTPPAGGFRTPTSVAVSAQPTSIAVADFNSDGRMDEVTANRSDCTVSVLRDDGNGGFVRPRFTRSARSR